MPLPLIIFGGAVLIALVSGLSALFFHWVSLGFEVKQAQLKITQAQKQAEDMQKELEQLKRGFTDG